MKVYRTNLCSNTVPALISLWPVLSIEEQFESRDELSSAFFPLTMIDLPLKSKSGQIYVHNILIYCDVRSPSLGRKTRCISKVIFCVCVSVSWCCGEEAFVGNRLPMSFQMNTLCLSIHLSFVISCCASLFFQNVRGSQSITRCHS